MPVRFDVFLSHATPDKPLVEELAGRLESKGLRPWLDTWNLIPGTAWMPEIETALAECAACAVIIGAGGFGPWQNEEMRAAITRRVNESRPGADGEGRPLHVIPVLLPGVERPERSKLPGFLTATTWVEFRDSLDDPEAFRRLVCGIRGVEPGARPGGAAFEGQCPYRGLELFDVDHAPLFFGREALTEWLLNALKRKPPGVENRFLAIVGASGGGKSSLARAGLMAALKDGKLDGSGSWPRAICRPGAEPFFSLARALTTIAPESVSAMVFDRLQGRKDGERSLHVAAGLVLGEPPRAERLVVLVDQFEEVFTLCNDEAERRDFIANLLHAATVAGGRSIVVLTMRADFYPRCASYDDLAVALSDHQVLVGPMTEDELRRAIDRPARLAGLEPEPGLVELLVDDIRGRAGALPLLQFALQEVWQRREDYRLTIRTYREIGQIEGALQRKADAVYGTFTDEQKELCRRVFLRLVQPGEGSEDTRRRASLRELLPNNPEQAGAVQAIISRLADPESRLLTTERQQTASGEATLEVAHEALIRGWPQLRKWIETDRAGHRTQLRLAEAAKEWADAGVETKEGTLYTGARLAVTSEWAASHRDELGVVEAAFLSASQEHERQKKADEAEKNRRLAEAERQRAEEAEARQQAERERAEKAELYAQEAVARQESERRRAEEAEGRRNAEEQRSLAEADRAQKAELLAEVRKKTALRLKQGTAALGGLLLLTIGLGLASWIESVKNGELAKTNETVANQAKGNEQIAKAKARTATSRQLAALSASERNKHLDCSLLLAVEALHADNTFEARDSLFKALQDRPGLESFLHMEEGKVLSVAFSPDGKTIAAAYSSSGGGVVLWDASGRQRLAEASLVVKEGKVLSVAFSPDGKTIAAGYSAIGGGGMVLWDVAGRQRLGEASLIVKEGKVSSVAFSPNGKTIAAGYHVEDRVSIGGRGSMVLWDVAGRKRLGEEPLPVKEGDVSSVAFSPDGKTIAAGCHSRLGLGGVVVWDVARRQRLGNTIAVMEGDVSSVAFSPDSKTIAAGYSTADGGGFGLGLGGVVDSSVAARLWVATELFVVKDGYVNSVAFSPDGKTIAAGYHVEDRVGIGGGVVVWDASVHQRLREDLLVKEGYVWSVTFSPDGKTLAAGYQDVGNRGGVVLWNVDLESWKRLARKIANRNFARDEWHQYFPDEPYRQTFLDLPVPPARGWEIGNPRR